MSVIPFTLICPLCQAENACGNELAKALEPLETQPNPISNSCWCQDPSLEFPTELLARVPEHLKGKSCICQNCVKIFLHEQNKQ